MASFEVGEDLRYIPRGSAYSFLALRGCKFFRRLCTLLAIASGRANTKGSPLQHPAIRFPNPMDGVDVPL